MATFQSTVTTLHLVFCFVAFATNTDADDPLIFFPGSKITLPEPQKCKNYANFCGGNKDKYPARKIGKIVRYTIDLQQSRETMDRFFMRHKEKTEPEVEHKYDNDTLENIQNLVPVCSSRTDFIPKFTRAKNLNGRWMYLIEGSRGETQPIEVTICKNPRDRCVCDEDAPHTRGRTSCKQLFRTQKLLAVAVDGEVMVDTFELPSACVCNYKLPLFDYGRRHLTLPMSFIRVLESMPDMGVECEANGQVTEALRPEPDDMTIPYDGVQNCSNSEYTRIMEDMPDPKPCEKGSKIGICDEQETKGYPMTAITSLLKRQKSTITYPRQFMKVFGSACNASIDTATTMRTAFFDLREMPLCSSHLRYIFPQTARSVEGKWRYIINTGEYRQGVTIEVCRRGAQGDSCKYDGAVGYNPDQTVCEQLYTKHNMLALVDQGLKFDTFEIPSACICHIKDPNFFSNKKVQQIT